MVSKVTAAAVVVLRGLYAAQQWSPAGDPIKKGRNKMKDEGKESYSVTELKEMFGRAVRTVSIVEMNRATAARGAEAGKPRPRGETPPCVLKTRPGMS